MSTALRTAALAVVALAAAAPALGQQARLTVAGGRIVDAAGVASTGVVAAPSVAWQGDGSELAAGAHGALFPEAEAGSAGVWAAGDLQLATAGPGGLRLRLDGGAAAATGGYRTVSGSLSPRLRAGGLTWRVEAGPQARWGGATVSTRVEPRWGRLFGGEPTVTDEMRWRQATGAAAEAALAHGPVGGRAGWSTLTAEGARWTDFTGALSLTGAAGELTLTAGHRTGAVEEGWVAGSAAVPLGATLSLVLEAGQSPSDPLTGRARGSYAAIGLSLHAARGVVERVRE